MTRFFITGTAGFIGYHLARRLLADGHHVTGYDAMTTYYDVALKQARNADLKTFERYSFVQGLLQDGAALSAAVRAASPEVIVHLAAQAGVRYSIEAPATYIDSNLHGSWQLLEIARAVQPRHLLCASTSSLYGANPAIPFSEMHRADEPLSLYAATKKGMEAMAHSYAHLFGIPSTMFRFFTVYGPWGRPDMALFKFVKAIRANEPIEVYGHGKMARDFTYVDDLVEAVVRLVDVAPAESNRVLDPAGIDTLSAEAPYRVVNIAGGHPTPLLDFIEIIEDVLKTKAVLSLMEMQPGDVPRTYADPSLLRALTDYVPDTKVHAGVAAFTRWYRDFYPN